jgi:hypothetical protein
LVVVLHIVGPTRAAVANMPEMITLELSVISARGCVRWCPEATAGTTTRETRDRPSVDEATVR